MPTLATEMHEYAAEEAAVVVRFSSGPSGGTAGLTYGANRPILYGEQNVAKRECR
jgi:hypothetical protein